MLLAASLLALSARATPPVSVKATYDLYRNNLFVATIQETFSHENGKYRIASEATAQGLLALIRDDRITRVSAGTVGKEGLRPDSFEEKRISHDREKVQSARFNWGDRKLDLTHDNKTETLSLRPGSQDMSSLFYQFLFIPPKNNVVKITVTNGKQLEDYVYRFVEEASLSTGAGKFETVHYAHVSEKGDRKTEIWLAKDKSYLTVQLKQEDDGTVLEQRLVALSFN